MDGITGEEGQTRRRLRTEGLRMKVRTWLYRLRYDDSSVCVGDPILPEESRPSSSVYRSAFTYCHTGEPQMTSTYSPPPHALKLSLNIKRKKKKDLRSFTKKWRTRNFRLLPLYLQSSRSFLPKWDAISISNIIWTNDQAKRVSDCVDYPCWKLVGPSELGVGVVLDMRIFEGWTCTETERVERAEKSPLLIKVYGANGR